MSPNGSRGASKHIPDPTRGRPPGNEWKKMIELRDWLIHAYDRSVPAIVWAVVETKSPELIQVLQAVKDESQS